MCRYQAEAEIARVHAEIEAEIEAELEAELDLDDELEAAASDGVGATTNIDDEFDALF